MEVVSASTRVTTRLITSVACLAMTATSLGSSLPVSAPITAPITEGLDRAQSVALLDVARAAAGHGEEELEAEVGDVTHGEGVLAVEVDSLNPVGLAGPRGAAQGVQQHRHELHRQLQHRGEQATILLRQRLGRVDDVITDVGVHGV